MSVFDVNAAITALVIATNDAIGATKPALYFHGENVPEQSAAWMRATILWNDGVPDTGGEGVVGNLVTGILHLAFFDVPGKGDGDLLGFIVTHRAPFAMTKVGGAQFYAPSGPQVATGDPAWTQLVVTCPFDYRET